MHKRIEKDEKEILDKEFYKKKYEKFLAEKENNLEKEKTGFSKIIEKNENIQSEELRGGVKKAGAGPSIKLAGKGINDNKLKKQRKLKDKYECKIFYILTD